MDQTNTTDDFTVSMEARDHECDIQGVVNNAHYQHYFEHARHRFLKDNGVDFAQLAKDGVNLMVQKIEIQYFAPLQAHDAFDVTVKVTPNGKVRYQFIQEIIHKTSQKLMSRALTTVITTGSDYLPVRQSPLSIFVKK